jgi:hypothetical protein
LQKPGAKTVKPAFSFPGDRRFHFLDPASQPKGAEAAHFPIQGLLVPGIPRRTLRARSINLVLLMFPSLFRSTVFIAAAVVGDRVPHR